MSHSLVVQRDAICPKCGQSFSHPVWFIVDLIERSDLAQRIRDDTINECDCPHCGVTITVNAPILIHDSKRERVLFCPSRDTSKEEEQQIASNLVNHLAETFANDVPDYIRTTGIVPHDMLPILLDADDVEAALNESKQQASALAEDLNLIVGEIFELKQPSEMPRRTELCRSGLTLMKQLNELRFGDPELWAILQVELGNSLSRNPVGDLVENIEQAIDCYQQALQVRTRQAVPVEWAATLANLGAAYWKRIRGDRAENIERAIDCYQQALQVQTRQAMPAEWAATLGNLGGAYSERIRGDPAENVERAIGYFQQALDVHTRQAMPIEWANTIANLAVAYRRRISGHIAENIEQAIDYYQQALQVRTRQAMPVQWASTLNNLAKAYLERIRGDRAENIERAIEYCQQALKVRTRKAMPVEWSLTVNNLAVAYSERIRGDGAENIERAIEHHQQALEVRTRQSMPIQWSDTVNDIAIAYLHRINGDRAENMERAIEYGQQGLEGLTRQAMPVEWSAAMMNLATAYKNRVRGDRAENMERAIDYYQQSLEVRTRQTMPVKWAETATNLAGAYSDRICGDRAENVNLAIGYYRQSLEVMTCQAMPDDHCRVQLNLGELYFKEGHWSQSVAAYQGALVAHNLLYQVALMPEARRALLRRARHLSHRLAYALAKTTEQLEALRESVVILEQSRARWIHEVLDLHSEKPMVVPDEVWQVFVSQREAVLDLLGEIRLPEDTLGKRDFLTLSEELKVTQQSLSAAAAHVRQYDERFMPEPSFCQLQEIVSKSNHPLVYFAVTPAGTLILIVSASTLHASQTSNICPLWSDLTESDLLSFLVNKDDEKITGYLPAQFDQANMDAALREVLPKLGARLMTPLAQKLRELGTNGAVLIPGGLLNLLPIGAAFIRDPIAGEAYAFVDEFDVAYAPSAMAVDYSYRRLSCIDPDPKRATLLAIGDPPHQGARRLPFANTEVQYIAHYFPSDKQRLLYGKQATREAIVTNTPGAAVLHFACHGKFESDSPLESALFLAGSGLLTLSDILGELSLQSCRLVILSACQTAIVDFGNLDEVIGLPSGFLLTGVPGTIGSLWSVDDISTALLMERFYYYYRQEGKPPISALRFAQRWLRDVTNEELCSYFEARREGVLDRRPMYYTLAQDRFIKRITKKPKERPFASPRFWAPFILHGI